MFFRNCLALTLAGSLACSAAYAQTGRLLTGGLSRWEGEVELGVLMDSGNTNATTFKGAMNLEQERENWRNSISLAARYRESEGQTTDERYNASTQADYKFNETDYTFVRGRYDDDRFAGLDYRISFVSGYGRRVWQGFERYLDLSAGLGYSVTQYLNPAPDKPDREEDPIARLALDFAYRISENAEFRQQINTEASLRNAESTSQSVSSLQANVGRYFALKVTYRVSRDSDAPQGVENTDTETSLTLLYSF